MAQYLKNKDLDKNEQENSDKELEQLIKEINDIETKHTQQQLNTESNDDEEDLDKELKQLEGQINLEKKDTAANVFEKNKTDYSHNDSHNEPQQTDVLLFNNVNGLNKVDTQQQNENDIHKFATSVKKDSFLERILLAAKKAQSVLNAFEGCYNIEIDNKVYRYKYISGDDNSLNGASICIVDDNGNGMLFTLGISRIDDICVPITQYQVMPHNLLQINRNNTTDRPVFTILSQGQNELNADGKKILSDLFIKCKPEIDDLLSKLNNEPAVLDAKKTDTHDIEIMDNMNKHEEHNANKHEENTVEENDAVNVDETATEVEAETDEAMPALQENGVGTTFYPANNNNIDNKLKQINQKKQSNRAFQQNFSLSNKDNQKLDANKSDTKNTIINTSRSQRDVKKTYQSKGVGVARVFFGIIFPPYGIYLLLKSLFLSDNTKNNDNNVQKQQPNIVNEQTVEKIDRAQSAGQDLDNIKNKDDLTNLTQTQKQQQIK